MIYFHHIAGTGGRSVIKSFLQYAGRGDQSANQLSAAFHSFFQVDGKVTVKNDLFFRGPGPPPRAFFACSHSPAYVCQIPPGTFRFTLMRDPITRFAGRYRQHYMALRGGYTTGWIGANILECAQQMPRSVVLRQLSMFSASFLVGEALQRLRSLGAVLRCERMEESMEVLSHRLHLDRPLGTFNVKEHSNVDRLRAEGKAKEIARGRKRVMEETRQHYAALQEIFEPEYRLMEALCL